MLNHLTAIRPDIGYSGDLHIKTDAKKGELANQTLSTPSSIQSNSIHKFYCGDCHTHFAIHVKGNVMICPRCPVCLADDITFYGRSEVRRVRV